MDIALSIYTLRQTPHTTQRRTLSIDITIRHLCDPDFHSVKYDVPEVEFGVI
jgi:hypothetical protein